MTSKANSNAQSTSPMTLQAMQRIQSATANPGNGTVPKESFAARASSAATKNSK